MRLLIIVISIIYSQVSLACYSPRGGEEYDNLIKLEKISGNTYRATVPRQLEDLKDAEIMLAYSEHGTKGIPVYEPYETLKSSYTKTSAGAEFKIDKNKPGKPYIVVMWWPKECCPCGIQANTKYIDIE